MPQRRLTALVVEDDDTIRESIMCVLELEGYAARPASCLDEARRALAESVPSIVVVDRMLPDGLADELLEELARRASAPPTVMVSASPAAPEVARSYGIAFVAKPFDIDGLLMAIQRAIAAEKKPSHPPPSR